jgi:hypothetical protein
MNCRALPDVAASRNIGLFQLLGASYAVSVAAQFVAARTGKTKPVNNRARIARCRACGDSRRLDNVETGMLDF